MNATNRVVNRVVLAIVGLVLLTSGGATLMATVWPAAQGAWRRSLSGARRWVADADAQTRLSDGTTVSWFVIGVLAVLVLLIVVAIVVIARLGGGRTGIVVQEDAGEGAQGRVTIGQGFASDAITRSLAGRDEILSSKVRTRRVRGTEMLHVSVTPRRNTSPLDAILTVTRLVDNLATLMGGQTPTYISVRSGARSRLAADQPRVR